MHTALEVSYRGDRVMIDCGEDWRAALADGTIRPRAILLTHAHPDHAGGLVDGAPCPVWATRRSWRTISAYPIEQGHTVPLRRATRICGIRFEAFPVEHSTRAPAVGYRITAGRISVFYCPDVVYIHDRRDALQGCRAYIGDGATMKRSFVRRRNDRLIGHVPVATQLAWCEKEGVPWAIITHCGTQIVTGDERTLGAQLRRWAAGRGIEAAIAHDGQVVILR